MNDQELITAVRQSVHGVHMNVPAEQIVGRSRAIRAGGHRRLAVCVTAVAAAGSVALGLGLSGTHGSAPNAATGTVRGTGTATIRTAAFTLTRNANGTDTLRLSQSQVFDPAALQQALAQDGIPALVKIGTHCSSSPAPSTPGRLNAVSVQLPDGTPAPRSTEPGHPNPVPADVVTVINPAAIPSGTELFFGYFDSNHGVFVNLIYTTSYTCNTSAPAGA